MSYQSVFRTGLFAGQHMVVTGGGSGIGRCLAHELASLGAVLHVVGRTEKKLQSVVTEIEEDGGQVFYLCCDIRDEDAVRLAVSAMIERAGPIAGLVNNAGGQYPSPLSAINAKGFKAVVETNLLGGFLMAREVFAQSMCRHGGAIVNMTADHWAGMPGMGHSGAARAGMDNLTKTAAVEWAAAGVRVNAVAPGWIASSGMDTYEGAVRAMIPTLRQAVPLKRLGTESEVSAVVCFLLSEAAAFVSGTTVRVDGAASQGNRIWPLGEVANDTSFDGFHRGALPEVLKDDPSGG